MTTLPAYLQPIQGTALVDSVLGNLGPGTPPYVSIQGNRFTLIDSTGASEPVTTVDAQTGMPYLDCVIVDALERESKVYYGVAFDPNSGSYAPPDCWSDNGIGPSRNAANPQHPTCASCPKAEWGSAVSKVTGKGVPACHKTQKLALMIPGDDVTFLLRVPPNSLGNLRDYLLKCKKFGIAVQHLITRVSFAREGIGTLTFWSPGYITEPMAKQAAEVTAAGSTGFLLGRGDQPREGLIAGASQAGNPQATLPATPMPTVVVQQPFAPTNAIQAPTQQAQPAAASQPEPARRRRRTQADIAAANQQPAQPAPGPQTAPFRPEPMPAAAPAPNGNFGIQQGVAPDPELSKTIDSIFGPSA